MGLWLSLYTTPTLSPSIPLPPTLPCMITGPRDLSGCSHWFSGEVQRSVLSSCCLLLFVVVWCFYVFTVFHVHRTSGPVLQTAYSVRTEGATFLHQLHCKLSFFSPPSTLPSDPGEGGRLVSKPSFSTCLVGRQFWLSSSLAGGRQLWVFLPRRRVPIFLTPQYTNG